MRDRALSEFAARLQNLGSRAGPVLSQALNQGGHAVRSQTVAAESAQTGLKQDTIDRAQHEIEATPGRLAYTITARGGNVRLKYFGAAEGGGGVTAHPWNRSTFYPRAFITSGRPGHRSPSPRLGGHVFQNTQGGRWRGKIKVMRSGVFIPAEMTTGQTAGAFNRGAHGVLATTVISRLGALLP